VNLSHISLEHSVMPSLKNTRNIFLVWTSSFWHPSGTAESFLWLCYIFFVWQTHITTGHK